MNNRVWFDRLQAGDQVAVVTADRRRLNTVTHRTTDRVYVGLRSFHLSAAGDVVGFGTGYQYVLEPANEADRAHGEAAERLVEALQRLPADYDVQDYGHRYPTDALVRASELLEQAAQVLVGGSALIPAADRQERNGPAPLDRGMQR